MTVVNPKSISGITSITTASGSDNLLTIHTNDGTERVRVDSAGTTKVGSGVTLSPDGDIFATGVTTSTTVQVGSATTIHTTGIDLGNGNLTGHNLHSTGITTSSSVIVGGGVTISESGIEASGIGITCANINGTHIGGRRNILINSEFSINQRGDSSVAISDGNFPCDRWKVANNGTLTGTAAVDSTTPTIDSNNFMRSIKVTSTSTTAASSAGDYAAIGQRLERNDAASFGWGTSNAQEVTLSFYVRSSKTGIFSAYLIGGNGFNRTFTFEYTIASADTWQKVVKTISGDTGGSWTYSSDNTIGLGLNFVLENLGSGAGTTSTLNSWQAGNNYAGSTNQVNLFDTNGATWYVAGVQLENGSQATPFEHRTHGEELALCQRYYQKHKYGAYIGVNFLGRKTGSNTVVGIMMGFPHTRAAASGSHTGAFKLYRITDGSTHSSTSVTVGQPSDYGHNTMKITAESTGSFSTGNMAMLYTGSSGGTFELDAEL